VGWVRDIVFVRCEISRVELRLCVFRGLAMWSVFLVASSCAKLLFQGAHCIVQAAEESLCSARR
jgi:hypothetical protein